MPVPTAYETPRNRVYGVLSFQIALADIGGSVDVATNLVPGFVGTIERVFWVQGTPVTTGGKAATLNLEINAVNLVGGVVALTSALCTPLGALINGTAVSGSNNFNRTDTISIEASGVTAFAEGNGMLRVVYSCEVYLT